MIYIATALLNAAIPFLLMPILTRMLGPEQYGILGAFIAVVNLSAVFVGLSSHGVISAVYHKASPDTFSAHVSSCLAVAFGSTICLSVVAIFAAPIVERATGIAGQWQWTILAAATGQFLLSVVLAVFQIRSQPLRFGAVQLGNSLAGLGLTLGLLFGTTLGWASRAVGQAVGALLVGALGLVFLYRDGGVTPRLDSQALGAVLRFGLPLVPHGVSAVLMGSFDRLFLTDQLGPASAGQYFVAAQIASLIPFFCAALNQAWVPWLYARLSENSDRSRHQIVQRTYKLFLIVALISIVISAFSPLLVQLFAGPGYEIAARILPLLAIGAFFSGSYYFVTNTIFYSQRTIWLSAVTAGVTVGQIGLTIILARNHGILGAAVATMAGAATYFTFVLLVANRLIPLPWLRGRRRA